MLEKTNVSEVVSALTDDEVIAMCAELVAVGNMDIAASMRDALIALAESVEDGSPSEGVYVDYGM